MSEVKYLKRLGTPPGDYFIATPALIKKAERDKDLHPYDPVTDKFLGFIGQPAPDKNGQFEDPLRQAAEQAASVTEAPKPVKEVQTPGRVMKDEDVPAPDPNNVNEILAAIPNLAETAWTKATGQRPAMPKVDAIIAALGHDITREERDAAYELYKKAHK